VVWCETKPFLACLSLLACMCWSLFVVSVFCGTLVNIVYRVISLLYSLRIVFRQQRFT
jgi:hypothetical protein